MLPSAIWLNTENAISQPRAASCGTAINSTMTAIAAAMKIADARLRGRLGATPFI